jgi:O-acetylserine/cysteine efflux transporter
MFERVTQEDAVSARKLATNVTTDVQRQMVLCPSIAPTERRLHTLVMIGLTPLYALCFVAIRIGLAYAPPLRFAALRTLVAGAALLVLARWRGLSVGLPRRSWPALLLLALSGGAIGYGTMFLSPGRAGAGIASVLGNTQPLIVIVLAAAFLRERLTWRKAVALAAGIAGVLLISAAALESASAAGLAGALLALVSAAAFGASTIIVTRMAPDVPLLTITGWQFLIGSLPLVTLSLLVEGQTAQAWDPLFLVIVAILALFGTALTTTVWYWLVQRDDAGRLSLFLFLVPVLGVGLAALTLGERIGVNEGIGIVLTLSGILVALRSADRDDDDAKSSFRASRLPLGASNT